MSLNTVEDQSNKPICVVIIEDDRATREGLAMLINGTPGYSCVGTFRSVEDALRGTGDKEPQVLLLDIHLPGMLGSEGIGLLRRKYASAEVLILTVYAEQDKVFESICNGACGYLLKETPPAKLLEAIKEACAGGSPMTPEIARKVVTLFQQTRPSETFDGHLSPQELKLLKLLAQGYSYQKAANHLNISINTIRQHIRSIYDKLHVHTKSEAVSKALRSRLIS